MLSPLLYRPRLQGAALSRIRHQGPRSLQNGLYCLRTADSLCRPAFHTRRRIILSGTPIQNDLGEFHAMVSPVFPFPCNAQYVFLGRILQSRVTWQVSCPFLADVTLSISQTITASSEKFTKPQFSKAGLRMLLQRRSSLGKLALRRWII